MMNAPLRLLVSLAAASVLYSGQAMAQTTGEAGMIGKRHAGVDFTYDDFSGSTVDRAVGLAAVANLPVAKAFDLGFGYTYGDASGPNNYGVIDRTVTGSLLTHRQTEYGTAYFAAALGHSWHRLDLPTIGIKDSGAFWGVRAGYEIPVGRATAVNLGLGYSDSFDSDIKRNQALRYYAEGNHWLSTDLAVVASVSYRQIKEAPDAITYTAGLRWAF